MIPKNWRWITLNDFAECLDNLRVPVNAKERSKRIGNIPYYGATGQTGWIDNYLTNEQLVLLGEDGAPFLDIFKDKAYIIDGKAWINNHVHILKSYFGDIGNRYLKYYLNNFDFKDYVSGTTRLKLTQFKMKNIPIPLPPFNEQQRIVDIIESLFSKLDRAKVLAQNIIDNYGLRRSAILHKAFTGELTDTNLNITDFSEVANIKCNLVSPKDYLNYPHIAPDNIEKKTGRLTSYHTVAEDKVISNKHRFYPGQILYSKIRPYLSKVIVAEFDGLCSADMYPIESKGSIKYMWYYMLSDEFLNQASNAGSRTLLPKINQKELSKIKVPICKLEEQKEIVRILDSLLAKEQRTKELAEQVINEVDLMKKAILARAFRGELVINKIQ